MPMSGCRVRSSAVVLERCETVGHMRDEVEATLFALGALVILSLVVPRINARQRDSRTGWDRLYDSPLGMVYTVAVVIVLVFGIVAVAASN
jgi:hypothetical protein